MRQFRRVGVVGLGVMGLSMARHLLAGGFSVRGYDIAETARRRASSEGISLEGSAAALAGDVEVLVTSLPSAAALQVVTSELLEAGTAPSVVVETSTLALADKVRLLEQLTPLGSIVLDCPISGTGQQIANGDAVIYTSGAQQVCEEVAPILECFARAVHYTGQYGNGTRMKFVANLLVAVHNVAAAEAIALAQRSGLEFPASLTALLDGAGASKMLEVRGPAMLERHYLPGAMRMGLFDKDLKLISDHATASGARTPLFTASLDVYRQGIEEGLIEEDTAAVFEVLIEGLE